MGDLIAWKTAEEVIKIITAENAMAAGMSIEEAAKALGYTLTKSGMYVKSVTTVASAAGAGATAGEAIAGAAATGGATASTANLTLYTTASGTTAVGGIGSIALPVAACCLAAAGGYKLGNVISDYVDEKYPDFFSGMFESVSEFLTGDEKSLAFIFDENGEAFMPKPSLDSISEYLDRQIAQKSPDYVNIGNIGVAFQQASIGDKIYCSWAESSNRLIFNQITSINSISPVYMFAIAKLTNNQINIFFTSKNPFNVYYQEYRNNSSGEINPYGKIYSHGSATASESGDYTAYTLAGFDGQMLTGFFTPTINYITEDFYNENIDNIVLSILNGNVVSGSNVPSGLQKGDKPDKGTIEVPSKYPSWYPIPLPSGDPYQLPSEFPDPNSDPDPSKISPYLPQPQPYPDGLPTPEPNPNPDSNPVVIPNPNPTPSPTPNPEPDPSIEPVPTPTPTPSPTPNPPTPSPTPVPPIPVIPPIGEDAGLLHVYNPTSEQINEFGRWLWTTFSGDLLDTLAKLFNNPMDAVIGLHELYCTPSRGASTTIKAGFLDSGVTSRLVSSRYVEINCGAITVPEYWGNYLDYAPYTKVYCYLPFIGIVELNTDDIIGHGVQILYKVDSYNGSCIAMIITAKTPDSEGTIYQFSGNCAVEVPITSGMKSALQSALIGAATCAVGAMGAGLAGVAVTDAAIVGGAKRGLNSKNTVAHSGSFGSSYGAMGIKKPYIIVKRPVQKKVYGYNKEYGYPAHQMVTVGSCSGYLRAREFEVKSTTATEEEKKRIEILLKEGVYV